MHMPEPVKIASELARPLVKKLDPPKKGSPMKTVFIVLAVILVGIGSGYGLNTLTGGISGIKSSTQVTPGGIKVGDVIGSPDEKSFPDQVEGVLVPGGIESEGSYHLLRPGGPSQNVYLTSSLVDLNLFVDHKVQIWGESFAAQKAGWLMDVGRVKILELNAPKPFEEETPTPSEE